MVKQDPLFFEGSIKNNIAIGFKNDEINSQKVKKCLELSGCDFVLKNKKVLILLTKMLQIFQQVKNKGWLLLELCIMIEKYFCLMKSPQTLIIKIPKT